MCMIRKDMKSVQDRLLTQMVSRRCTFDPSVWIRPKTVWLVSLSAFNPVSLTLSAGQCSFKSLFITFSLQRIFDEDDTLYSLKYIFFFPESSFVARGGDPECEERSAHFVFPLTESYRRYPMYEQGYVFHRSDAHCTVHLAVQIFIFAFVTSEDFSGFCFYSLLYFWFMLTQICSYCSIEHVALIFIIIY